MAVLFFLRSNFLEESFLTSPLNGIISIDDRNQAKSAFRSNSKARRESMKHAKLQERQISHDKLYNRLPISQSFVFPFKDFSFSLIKYNKKQTFRCFVILTIVFCSHRTSFSILTILDSVNFLSVRRMPFIIF